MTLPIKDGEGNTTTLNTVLEVDEHTPVHAVTTNLANAFTAGGDFSLDIETKQLLLKAPVAAEPYSQIKLIYNSLEMATCKIYEDPTTTVDGTQVVIQRANRQLASVSDSNSELYTMPTSTANGTLVTSLVESTDMLLTNDKKYLIIFESFTTSNFIKWQLLFEEKII